MRCECCDELLSDAEATAKFAGSGAYVGMCGECRKSLPSDLKIITRRDLEKTREREVNKDVDEGAPFYFEDGEEWDGS